MPLSNMILRKKGLLVFAGKHPILKYNLLADFIDAYFHGLVLVALDDVKTIPPERNIDLEKLQVALNLEVTDTSQKIQQVINLDENIRFEMLKEVIPTIAAHRKAATLFFLEAVALMVQGKYNKKERALFCSHLAGILEINEKSMVFSLSMNLISQGISSSTITPFARVFSWSTLAYFFPQVIKACDARNQDLIAEIKSHDAAFCEELMQKMYPDLGREGILILLLPYLKKLVAQLEKIIQDSEGKCEHSRYYLNLEGCEALERFKSSIQLIDRYWFKYPQYFAMNPSQKIQARISWTQVKEPKDVAKANYIEFLKTFLEELEFRLA